MRKKKNKRGLTDAYLAMLRRSREIPGESIGCGLRGDPEPNPPTPPEPVSQECRWSGWPGAWCLDCGRSDPREDALADGDWSEERAFDLICTESGSNRHNPYRRI
jgi:hypothetical protein